MDIVIVCGVVVLFGFVIFSAVHLWIKKKPYKDAISKAIGSVDVIIDGKRYIGSKARAVATDQGLSPFRMGQEVVVRQLCCTEGGQWFTLTFTTWSGLLVSESITVKPISIDSAKQILATRPDLREKEFGSAEIA